MAELSSLDFRTLVEELQFLVGGKIQKIYHEGRYLHISVFVKGRGTNVLVAGGGTLFTTAHSLKHKERPSGFCMFLRKRLSGQWIGKLCQVGFERIVVLETQDYKIYFELFRNGNTIIADKDDKIVSVMSVQIWKGRVLKAHEIYKMPPLSVNTAELDETAFGKMLGMSERRAISFLARDLGFGGNYAEEILLRADIDKDVTAKHVSVSKIKSFFGVVSEILICDKEPQVIVENDSNKDVSLFSLSKYDSFDKIKFDTLVQAIEEFYLSQMDIEEEKQVTSKLDKKKDQFEYRLKIQFNSLENMKKVIEECNKKAEMIYTNYIVLESMISQVNEACISKGQAFVEKEIRDGRVNKIRSINLKEKVIVVELGMDLNIYLDKPLSYSAEMYYQRAKKSKGKLPGIEKSIVLTSKSLERQEHEISQKPVRDVRKAVEKKEWYDKFRHFRSLKGFLVLGGKDATSNEVLIKKHTDKDDLVFHADVAGSPFVIVKSEAKKVDEKTLAEAAQFAGAYSKAWKMKTGTVDVYWVTPDQVSRQAPSGEYIQKGSFMVRGKKNWLKPELRISFALVGDMVICGPEITVSGMTTKYVTIVPGYRKSKELAKDVRTKLFYISSKKEQEILKTISVDSIQRFIPSGTGDIFK